METFTRLRGTFDGGRTRDRGWRTGQLRAIERMLVECEDEFAAALAEDLGRTPFESVLLDLAPTKAEVRHALRNLRGWMRPHRVRAPLGTRPGRAWYEHEPLGVVLIIGPWNYPVHLVVAPLIAAVSAGNCAVIKPSEFAPASSAALAKAIPGYLDPGAFAVVEGDADVTRALLDQAPDHCFFTGGPAVGKEIMAAAARHLTPVTLELGGKCPAIVTESARVGVAARRIAFGKLLNSGQTCISPDYVLVDRRVRDEFVEELVAAVRTFSEGGDQRIVNPRHAARLAGLLVDAGGRTVLGGTVDAEGARAQPTVIVDPEPGAALLREEIFGPLLPVVTVGSLEEAVGHVRRGTRPLATYLFTEKRDDERRVLREIVTGGTVVNHVMMHHAVSDLPFGGVGTSGTGRYHGRWGFEALSNPKAVLRKPSRPDLSFMYPPYSPSAQRLMGRLLR
ncbi:aldehyde dehydrogenase family protein [Actinocorallia longicatena]|uniref:Aldehyde dehydrogenase n=1 Tax=Actinocorallia longicatena TaxID=111803 RepID=A0ABP6QAC7_9ACTN